MFFICKELRVEKGRLELNKAEPEKEFKQTLYEALLVAFGKILSKYNVFAQGSILKDVGQEIIAYLNNHGFIFEETGNLDDLTTLTELFVKNGFADKLDIEESVNGHKYTWHNLYGINAYKELLDVVDNPFLSCPLNLCLYYIADKHNKTMKLYSKTFNMNDKSSVTDYAVVEKAFISKQTPEGQEIDPLGIENGRLYQLARERADRLEKAQKEIKVLRGFIPICASCKKVRDDAGYWQQVESYITGHSEALFTHSLCPDCVEKWYPETQIPEKKLAAKKKTVAKKAPARKNKKSA
jgi:hypothetical protein